MNQQLRMFCDNWINKADQYSNSQLSDYFDKFVSLYVVFNAIYVEVMYELILAGAAVPPSFGDKKAATDYLLLHLKSRGLYKTLNR